MTHSLMTHSLMTSPRALLLAALLVALTPSALQAQDSVLRHVPDSLRAPAAPVETPGPWVPSLRSIGQNGLDVLTSPVDGVRHHPLKLAGAAGAVTGLVLLADRPAQKHLRQGGDNAASEATSPLAAPGRLYDRAGANPVYLGTIGLLAGGGLVMQNRHWTRTSVRTAEALLFARAVNGFAKSLINRSRPTVTTDPTEASIGTFSGAHDKLSMPSGHSADAFAVATVLARSFDGWYVAPLAYTAATSIGIERVRSGDHWLSDVVVGAAIGHLIGRTVTSPRPGSSRVRYAPLLSPTHVGVVVRF